MAAASAAGAVGGNIQAQMISSSNHTSDTMILSFAAWISVPISNDVSYNFMYKSANALIDCSPTRNLSNISPI